MEQYLRREKKKKLFLHESTLVSFEESCVCVLIKKEAKLRESHSGRKS